MSAQEFAPEMNLMIGLNAEHGATVGVRSNNWRLTHRKDFTDHILNAGDGVSLGGGGPP